MVSLPVPPVKAPSPNYCPSLSKPFACHTSAKSLKFSASSNIATTSRKIVPGSANPFTHISFADPHPLNSVLSYCCKKGEGRVRRLDVQTFRRADAKSFALNIFADPHPLNLYGSIFYKKGGRGGGSHSPCTLYSSNGNADLPIGALVSKSPDISSPSNLPNSPEDSSCQKLAAQKSGFVILKLR